MQQLKYLVLTIVAAGTFAKPSQAIKPSRICIIGKFQKPGFYSFSSQWRIIDAIAMAGGVTAKPDSLRLNVHRGNKTLPVDLLRLISTHSAQNLQLQPGDVIIAFDALSGVEPPIPSQFPDSPSQAAPRKLPEQRPFEFFPQARFWLLDENRTKQK